MGGKVDGWATRRITEKHWEGDEWTRNGNFLNGKQCNAIDNNTRVKGTTTEKTTSRQTHFEMMMDQPIDRLKQKKGNAYTHTHTNRHTLTNESCRTGEKPFRSCWELCLGCCWLFEKAPQLDSNIHTISYCSSSYIFFFTIFVSSII